MRALPSCAGAVVRRRSLRSSDQVVEPGRRVSAHTPIRLDHMRRSVVGS